MVESEEERDPEDKNPRNCHRKRKINNEAISVIIIQISYADMQLLRIGIISQEAKNNFPENRESSCEALCYSNNKDYFLRKRGCPQR